MKKSILLAFICFFLGKIFIINSYAQELKKTVETDWLKTEVGSTGDILGAKVIGLDSEPEKELTVIDVMLPENIDFSLESVEVIGKESQKEIKQTREPEWLKNYEDGSYGVRLHLKRPKGFVFRLRLSDTDIDSNTPEN